MTIKRNEVKQEQFEASKREGEKIENVTNQFLAGTISIEEAEREAKQVQKENENWWKTRGTEEKVADAKASRQRQGEAAAARAAAGDAHKGEMRPNTCHQLMAVVDGYPDDDLVFMRSWFLNGVVMSMVGFADLKRTQIETSRQQWVIAHRMWKDDEISREQLDQIQEQGERQQGELAAAEYFIRQAKMAYFQLTGKSWMPRPRSSGSSLRQTRMADQGEQTVAAYRQQKRDEAPF